MALLHAYERYQGADADSSEPNVHRQARAMSESELRTCSRTRPEHRAPPLGRRRAASRIPTSATSSSAGTTSTCSTPRWTASARAASRRPRSGASTTRASPTTRSLSCASATRETSRPRGSRPTRRSRTRCAAWPTGSSPRSSPRRRSPATPRRWRARRTSRRPPHSPPSRPRPTRASCDFASTSTSNDGDALTVRWDFGDGAADSGANAAHTYDTAGTYTATQTVTDRLRERHHDEERPAGHVNQPPTGLVHRNAQLRPRAAARGVRRLRLERCRRLGIAAYHWVFGDGGAAATARSVSHDYVAGGSFSGHAAS